MVELGGRTVTPGFQDAHVHPIGAGLDAIRCNLHGLPGRDAYLAAIADYAASHPDVPWITGGGWAMHDFPGGTPRAEDLDRVVPDRPVFLPNKDGHGAWVNTRALELAGITSATRDPADGRIERDPDGSPTGTLHEGAAELVERLIPSDTAEDMLEALDFAQGELHRLGITAWQDAWVLPDMIDAYRRFAEQGGLTARVIGAHWWDRGREPGTDRGLAGPSGARVLRPVPGNKRQAHPRRRWPRTSPPPCSVRTSTGQARPPPTAASTSSTPRSWPMP